MFPNCGHLYSPFPSLPPSLFSTQTPPSCNRPFISHLTSPPFLQVTSPGSPGPSGPPPPPRSAPPRSSPAPRQPWSPTRHVPTSPPRGSRGTSPPSPCSWEAPLRSLGRTRGGTYWALSSTCKCLRWRSIWRLRFRPSSSRVLTG
jgi:hypothetical protein